MPFTGDADFDHLIKGVIWFLLCIVTSFPFAANNQSVQWYFKAIKISCFLIKSILLPSLIQTLLWWWQNNDFSKWASHPTFTSCHSAFYCKQKSHPSFVYIFTSQYGLMNSIFSFVYNSLLPLLILVLRSPKFSQLELFKLTPESLYSPIIFLSNSWAIPYFAT